MTYYLNSGGKWRPNRDSALDVRTTLPPGNYIIDVDEYKNLFLSPVGEFQLPAKIYGDTQANTRRIISTFFDRPNSTGVLLVGGKGSGKTLLSKNVSTELLRRNVPTIIVNHPFVGDSFNDFLQSIDQPCVVLFDEFEKVYHKTEQQYGLLTLLDGVFPSQKLFLLTCNDMYRVDTHMRNRPGRIYYMFKFGHMERHFIEEYCQDNLHDKSQIDAVCRLTGIFGEFNFDMLVALVEEMNRFDEPAHEAIKILNIRPENDTEGRFRVTIVAEGHTYCGEKDFYDDGEIYTGSPVLANGTQGFVVKQYSDDGDYNLHTHYFSAEDFKRYDNVNAEFHFERDGVKLILAREKTKTATLDYRAY